MTTAINVGNSWIHIDCGEQLASKIDRAFAVDKKGARFSPAYRRKAWDGKIHLFNRFGMKLPAGLLTKLLDVLRDLGEEYVVNDKLDVPSMPVLRSPEEMRCCLNGVQLRDYQLKAAWDAITQHRGILKLATNAGKTEVAAAIIKSLSLQTLYLIHRKELLHQTAERLEMRTGLKVSRVGDGLCEDGKLIVAMVQTLAKMEKRAKSGILGKTQLLIMDECFHGSASTWSTPAMACNAYYRFGMSGTPFGDEMDRNYRLIGITGPVICEVKNEDLVDSGISAMPEISVFLQEHPENDWSWWKAYNRMVVLNSDYNLKIARLASRLAEDGERILIICDRLAQGRRIMENMSRYESSCEFIHGSLPSEIRNRAIENLKRGRLSVLVSTSIFDEGIDVPAVSVLILASIGKSQVQLLQRVGRALRKKEGTANVATIFDFQHVGNKYLEGHFDKRLETYKQEGFPVCWIGR